MTKAEKTRIVELAEATTFGPEYAVLAGDAADAIHANPRATLPARNAAALVKWQARNMNGEWDANALNEILDFMAKAIIL